MKRRESGTERRWIKLHTRACLKGSIRFDLEPDERSVWYDLLLLCGDGRSEGLLQASDGHPFPHSWIAHTLNIPEELLERTLAKCKKEGRIKEDKHGIHIIHWGKYQGGYQLGSEGKPDLPGGKTPSGKKALMKLKEERKRLGLCENCGEEGHNKYACPHSKYQHMAQK